MPVRILPNLSPFGTFVLIFKFLAHKTYAICMNDFISESLKGTDCFIAFSVNIISIQYLKVVFIRAVLFQNNIATEKNV